MNIPSNMKSLEVSSMTGPQAIRLIERPVPQPGPGEVLIKVGAAGVNYADIMQTRGAYPPITKAPFFAGIEICGEIVALGNGDTVHPIGAKVIGAGLSGGWSEYTVAPAAALMPLPEGWTEAQGAAFFVNWITAFISLRTLGHIAEGQSVLIHAAAGGVGQAAVRLAKHFGARVFATASTTQKLETARALGADELINNVEQDFVAEVKSRTDGRGVDLLLEMVGGETFRKNLKAVVPYGNIIVYGYVSGERASVDNIELVWDYSVNIVGLAIGSLMEHRPDLFGPAISEIGELIASGVMRPQEPVKHDLAEAGRVLADLEARKTSGKHVLIP